MKNRFVILSGNRLVAQVGNLLFRRLAVGRPWEGADACGLPIRDTADNQSALRFRGSMREFVRGILTLIALALSTMAPAHAALQVQQLRCEYRVNPLGIDEAQPRLTWRVDSNERGQRQTACQILVASSEELLKRNSGDLWDSGKIASDQTVNIVYGGKPLGSRQQCFWKVRVWDKDGKPAWSDPALWSMGLLKPADWQANYISFRDTTPVHKDLKSLFLPPARQYRKEFAAAKNVRRATIYATALGIYELHLNGQRVGDALFAPGWTDYHQRAYYWTYDVTPLVRKGENALGAWLADGWYSGYIGFGLLMGLGTEKVGRYTYGKTPGLMAQLEIEYTDGSREIIVTDPSWKVTGDGPIREGDFLMGEFYDARKETAGWTKAGFDDSGWPPAIRAEENGSVPATFYEDANPSPGEKPQAKGRPVDLGFKRPPTLEAFPGVPVRATEEIKPVAITSPTNGVYIFNLGQNFAGVIRLQVKGPAGAVIQLRYGEMLHPDGRLMTENLRKARATDHYVLRGDPNGETWTPRFTFHGFQYVEVTGYPGTPDKDAITGVVLHSDTPLTSGFECSDPVPNRLFKNVVWTQRANFLDLPTDCPQRDERFGWTGDAQIYARTATYNADVAAFYTKWLRELMESQRPSGTFPGYAPYPFQHGWDFGTAWCDAGVICPWAVWQAYGDTRIIERCWPFMARFIEWRKATSRNFLGVNHGNDWGDWLSFGGKTPLDYTDSIYFGYSTKLMAGMAQAIGREKEAAEYRELLANIKAAFNRKYVKPDGTLAVDTQTAYALALYADLLPDNLRTTAGAILAKKIRDAETPDNSGMTTGFLGTRPLLPVLSDTGQHDFAVKHFQSRKFPSWGYEVEQGATTIWERWNGYTKDKGFGGEQNATMNSFAHYSFGAVCEWMLSRLAGIESDGPGYQRIIIRPSPPSPGSNPEREPINWVKAHYDSIHGRIVSNWRRTANAFELDTAIPANTTATVFLPAKSPDSVKESGQPLAKAKCVKFLRQEGDRVLLTVESGSYRFTSQP
jgi:alpha-L-rhamnosidase